MAPVDGAAPVHPPMDSLHLDGMHVLQTTGDTFALQHVLAAGGARSALVVERHLKRFARPGDMIGVSPGSMAG